MRSRTTISICRLTLLIGPFAALLVYAMATARPVHATFPGTNGQIAFTRLVDPVTGETHIFIANPDGTEEHELPLPLVGANAFWSPDGSKLVATFFTNAGLGPATFNPDGSGFTVLDVPELPQDRDITCQAWSRDGTLLLCGVISVADPALNGIYNIRASDGGGLTRLTVNPFPPTGNFGGGDLPGDYSPDGTQFVFVRAKPGAGPVPDRNQSGALFVENADGTGLRQITPYGLANSHGDGFAHWSPDGKEIVFASAQGLLFVVHPDGTGVRKIPFDTGGSFSFALAPNWSPDGASIVFNLFLQKKGQFDIYTVRSDGSQLVQVTNTPNFEDVPDWGTHPLQ